MKVYPIQNLMACSIYNNKQKNNNSISNPTITNVISMPDNYGRALVNFEAKPKSIKTLVKNAPIDEKLLAAMTVMEGHDVLLLSGNSKKAMRALRENANKITIPMKKIYQMQVPKLEEIIAFHVDPESDLFNIINLGETPITMKSMFGDSRAVEPGQKDSVEMCDKIVSSIGELTTLSAVMDDVDEEKEKASFELTDYTHLFMTEIDKSEIFTETVRKHNQKVLTEVAKEDESNVKKITFADVGGQDEVILKLKKKLLLPQKFPKAYKGVSPTKFAILYGKPGTGKSFLAEAFANEANASIFSVTPGELKGSLVGESEKKCKELFTKAIDAQPSVIFIDEINALTSKRNDNDIYGAQLLEEFLNHTGRLEKSDDKVIILGATNRIDAIDEAILRSGRFDLQLEIKEPDLEGTEAILKLKIKDFDLDKDVDTAEVAQKAFEKKLTGADLMFVARTAHENALERTGIIDSMLAGKFSELELDNFTVKQEDLLKAVEDFEMTVELADEATNVIE